MDLKTQFIADYLRRTLSITELCQQYKISRKTGYKWIDRYLADGARALGDRSHRPHFCPHQTPTKLVEAILEARRHHPTWGPRSYSRSFPTANLTLLGLREPPFASCSRATA